MIPLPLSFVSLSTDCNNSYIPFFVRHSFVQNEQSLQLDFSCTLITVSLDLEEHKNSFPTDKYAGKESHDKTAGPGGIRS
jgi:hypothetical protein